MKIQEIVPPMVELTFSGNTFVFSSDKELFTFPYGAVKDSSGSYRRIRPLEQIPTISSHRYHWTFDLTGIPYSEFVVGCCDAAGNGVVSKKFRR